MDLQLSAIVDSIEDPILSVSEDLRVLFMNAAAAKKFECRREEVLRQPLDRFPLLREGLEQLKLADLRLTEETPQTVRRIQGRRREGQSVSMEASITATQAEGERVYTVVLRDITLPQQVEQAVYQARKNQAIGSLASGIAHDFNNILTAVISQIDLALYAQELAPTLKENLVYAKASARRGAELVSRLQLFSGQAESKFAPLDLAGVVEQVVFMLRRSIDPRVRIRYDEPTGPRWLVHADASQIMQVLMNLGLNARDAMPQGGELAFQITLETSDLSRGGAPRKPGDYVKISVLDTGQGRATH